MAAQQQDKEDVTKESLEDSEKINKPYDDKKPTPNQKRSCRLWWDAGVSAFILVVFVSCIVFRCLLSPLLDCPNIRNNIRLNIIKTPQIIAAIIAVLSAVLTFFLNEASKASALAQEEAGKKKLYFSEFDDLMRHLEANLKVMIEVHKTMEEGKVPASIHFENLSWPKTSCLLSDDITKILDKEKVDDFSRLKVNIRNINNSSEWLASYVKENHSHKEIRDAIEWEITRHIGHLISFRYLKDNDFQFPELKDIKKYIKKTHIKQKLTKLFMSYPIKERKEKVKSYLVRYFEDRSECRNILFYSR